MPINEERYDRAQDFSVCRPLSAHQMRSKPSGLQVATKHDGAAYRTSQVAG